VNSDRGCPAVVRSVWPVGRCPALAAPRGWPPAIAPALAPTPPCCLPTRPPSWHEAYPELPFDFAGAAHHVEIGHGLLSEPDRTGRAGRLLRAARAFSAAGVAGALLGRRSRALSAVAGGLLLVASALTRFGIFEGGVVSSKDPKFTMLPQRERLAAHGGAVLPDHQGDPVIPAGEQLADNRVARNLAGHQQAT
jgi:hypothetical protein